MHFTEFDNMVARLTNDAADAAECHGHLLGLLCAQIENPVGQWLDALLSAAPSDNALLEEARMEMDAVGRLLVGKVADGNLEYQLLLPDDDEPLSERAAALAHWCQGFLFGMAQGGIKNFAGLPGDCSELLNDFSEITKLTVENDTEEDEAAFIELEEFVRVGSQLIFEEMQTLTRATHQATH